MEPKSNNSNLILFMAIALAILLGWGYLFPAQEASKPITSTSEQTQTHPQQVPTKEDLAENNLMNGKLISVKTDVYDLKIDTNSGDIRQLVLSKFNAAEDEKLPFILFNNSEKNIYIAQSGLLNQNNQYLLQNTVFTTDSTQYTMTGEDLKVKLSAPEQDGLQINKIFTFKKGSYVINIAYEISNKSKKPVDLSAMYRLLRDDSTPSGGNHFAYTYTGPVLYTPEGKFQKMSFDAIAKNNAEFIKQSHTGWLGFIQHYFAATWILQAKSQNSICGQDSSCQIDFSKRKKDGLFSAGFTTHIPTIQPDTTVSFPVNLFAGPQEYRALTKVADKLELVKDYGKVHIFAAPLFWLLDHLHGLVHNWGWAIILLVVCIKIVFYPLTATSYKSMAKMRAVAPKLQALKAEYGEDRMKMQQEMMALYKKEKINPLGGCLPMLLQIPVFIGLYWALFNSVELRQAPWIGWITDLSRTDPYYILPTIMALTMFLQTFLNPPPTDPMQAKMMKIMPIVFSVMFFFFPAGLVLYWVVNNILSIAQQWLINKKMQESTHHS